jgi:ATP-dependent RNA circularization protein (DNA/RNA ligase family)
MAFGKLHRLETPTAKTVHAITSDEPVSVVFECDFATIDKAEQARTVLRNLNTTMKVVVQTGKIHVRETSCTIGGNKKTGQLNL